MNNFSSLLHYISEWVLQLHITFCMAPSFLQQFIYTTKDVILPTTGHWKYYILCILPALTQTCQQGYFTECELLSK